MKTLNKLLLLSAMLMFIATSCFNDLETTPIDDDEFTASIVYDDPSSYKRVLAKLYAGLAVSGQQGPSGQPDISGIDEGFSTYLRQYWKAQELSTDEAVIAWNDGTIQDFHQQDWDANSEFLSAMYNRIFYQISLCNEFVRETTDEKLNARNVDSATKTLVEGYRSEARFLRALSYSHALDLFRNVPFVTENDAVGSFFPEQASPNELFTYIESELRAIETLLPAPNTNEYARADQAAAWAILAKLYLNAEVYIGSGKYNEAVEYSSKVINAGYNLAPNYGDNFLADNHTSEEVIFPVAFDGLRTKTWGGITFLVHAAVGGDMAPSDFGIDGGWGGIRTTSAIVNKFPVVGSGEPLVSPAEKQDLPVLYVPGSYQTEAWMPENTSTVLVSANDDGYYDGYFFFPENTEFKVTDGPGWDVNYGDSGADGTLDQNGDNFIVEEEGFYRVEVNLNESTVNINKVEWGLIGSATPDGWDADQDLTYLAEENAWSIELELVEGEIKFRANDDWAINMGDTGPDGYLGYNADNIVIPSSGLYLIKLFLEGGNFTYSIAQPAFDGRAMFYTENQNLEIADISQFTDGYAITKFKNISRNGTVGTDLTFPDTDFPLIRLAEVYLTYAEAVLRGGAGDLGQALGYVNALRERSYEGPAGNISQDELTLDFILDERARELLWECHRRTDLIRFGQFSNGSYVWPWKGGTPDGVPVESYRDIYPIPSSDIGANPNLTQNPNY